MKRNELVQVKINGMRFPNLGVGTAPGVEREFAIKEAFPGQLVTARIGKKRNNRIEAKLVEVLEKADYEVPSFCPHFGSCGGCMMQTIPYERQLELKRDMVLKLFKNADITDFTFDGIVASPDPMAYRNKMEYSFGNEVKNGETTLGMHRKGRFYDIVTVNHCKIVHDDFNKILTYTLEYALKNNLPHYNRMSHEGFLRHFVVRKGFNTGEILVALSTSLQVDHDFSDFVAGLESLELDGQIVGVLQVMNTAKADAVQGEYKILSGRDYYMEELMGLKFKVSLYSFFQTNTAGAERLYNKTLEYTGAVEGMNVYDLFSGTGTIGQIASTKAKSVVGIELVEDAVKAACENAKLNGISNAQFIAGDVFAVLSQATHIHDENIISGLNIPKPDVIIVDPPRVGISEKAFEQILNYGVPAITYVSCNPKTLVENLKQAEKLGYHTEKLCLVDMFPHTGHVECVVRLQRQNP